MIKSFEERQQKVTEVFNTLVAQGRPLDKVLNILIVDEAEDDWSLLHNSLVFKLAWEYRLNMRLGAK